MTGTAVTPFPGVSRRKDSARWAFVLSAPQDLLHRFDGSPWAVRCSLGTSDPRQANDKARALHAEWAAKFAAMRLEDSAQAAEKIAPARDASCGAGTGAGRGAPGTDDSIVCRALPKSCAWAALVLGNPWWALPARLAA